MRKYKTIQVKKETHELLQKYCNEHGHSMSWLIHKMITDIVGIPKPTENAMRSIPKVPSNERFNGTVT